MFSVGEKIVYPMHGAGVVEAIEQKEIGGKLVEYYKVKIIIGNITVMIPVNNTSGVQLRPLIDEATAKSVLDSFGMIPKKGDIPWNKRYKYNFDRLKTGEIENVSAVLDELMEREKSHGLSTSDRKMFILTKNIFCSEIGAALGVDPYIIFEQVISKIS